MSLLFLKKFNILISLAVTFLIPQNPFAQPANSFKSPTYHYMRELTKIQGRYLEHEFNLTKDSEPFPSQFGKMLFSGDNLNYVINKIMSIDSLNAASPNVDQKLKNFVLYANAQSKDVLKVQLQYSGANIKAFKNLDEDFRKIFGDEYDQLSLFEISLRRMGMAEKYKNDRNLYLQEEKDFQEKWQKALSDAAERNPELLPFSYRPFASNPFAGFKRMRSDIIPFNDVFGNGTSGDLAYDLGTLSEIHRIKVAPGNHSWQYFFRISPLHDQKLNIYVHGVNGNVYTHFYEMNLMRQLIPLATVDSQDAIAVASPAQASFFSAATHHNTIFVNLAHFQDHYWGQMHQGSGATIYIWSGEPSKLNAADTTHMPTIELGPNTITIVPPEKQPAYKEARAKEIEAEIRTQLAAETTFSGYQITASYPIPIQAKLSIKNDLVVGKMYRPLSGSKSRLEGKVEGSTVTFQELEYLEKPGKQYKDNEGFGGSYTLDYFPSGIGKKFIGTSTNSEWVRFFIREPVGELKTLVSSSNNANALATFDCTYNLPYLMNVKAHGNQQNLLSGKLIATENNKIIEIEGFAGDETAILYATSEKQPLPYFFSFSEISAAREVPGRTSHKGRCRRISLTIPNFDATNLEQLLTYAPIDGTISNTANKFSAGIEFKFSEKAGKINALLDMKFAEIEFEGERVGNFIVLNGKKYKKKAKSYSNYKYNKDRLVLWYAEHEIKPTLTGIHIMKYKGGKSYFGSSVTFDLSQNMRNLRFINQEMKANTEILEREKRLMENIKNEKNQ